MEKVHQHGLCTTGRRLCFYAIAIVDELFRLKGVTQAGVPQEGTRVGPQARPEYLAQMRDRYVGASRTEKGRVLTEAVTVTGYHRKAIIRA